jgi:uncharacterized protein YjbJ (UPF0337 family)
MAGATGAAIRAESAKIRPSPGTASGPDLFLSQRPGVPPRPSRRRKVGELTDKIKGNVNEAAGKLKQRSNDPDKRSEGETQEAKGKGQQFMGKVKGALGDDI